VVLDSHIGVLFFPMRNLREEPTHQCLPDASMKFALVLCADEVEMGSPHRSLELLSDVLSLLECSLREVVIPAPIPIVFV
jgi:hypothetical protein